MAALDTRVFFVLYAAGPAQLLALALVLSAVGEGSITLCLVPLCAARRWRRFAIDLAAVVACSAIVVFALKVIVGRPRPCIALAGVRALSAMPTDPSFPSGHACGAFAVVTFLIVVMHARPALFGRPVARAALSMMLAAVAIGIAWSRVYLGVHFPVDVAGGALLGMLSGALGGRIHLRTARAPRP